MRCIQDGAMDFHHCEEPVLKVRATISSNQQHIHYFIIKIANFLATFLAFYLGCAGCFFLRQGFSATPILAASLLGVLITFVPVPRHLDKKTFQIVFCTGTFAAMSSEKIMWTPWHLAAISLLGAGVYIIAKPYFIGIGGKMGMLAFLTTVVWLMMRLLA
jgi:hypothetical protein